MCIRENMILAPEARRDISYTPKCAQWPHLYKSYEAIYGLKRLVFEKIAKNGYFYPRAGRFQEICNLAPEGRRDFSDTAKSAQWSHLYMSYEATYGSVSYTHLTLQTIYSV